MGWSKRLFACDQAGKVWIVRDEMVLPTPFLDLVSKLVPKAPTTYPFPLSNPTMSGAVPGWRFIRTTTDGTSNLCGMNIFILAWVTGRGH